MSHVESVAQEKSHYFFLAKYKPTSKMLIHGFMDSFAQKNDHLKKIVFGQIKQNPLDKLKNCFIYSSKNTQN